MQNTVLCIKWGTRYSAKYVNILHHSVMRNLSFKHRFVCLTDDPKGLSEGIKTFPLIEMPVPNGHQNHPWRKLMTFSPQLSEEYKIRGRVLFLDLDLVITGGLNDLFLRPGQFLIIRDWRRNFRLRKALGICTIVGNTSVYRFEAGDQQQIWQTFIRDPQKACDSYPDEQTFVTKNAKSLQFLPQEWCVNFKRQILPPWFLRRLRMARLPKDAKIVVFNGVPKPHEVIEGKWRGKHSNRLQRLKAAEWCATHWCDQGN